MSGGEGDIAVFELFQFDFSCLVFEKMWYEILIIICAVYIYQLLIW